MIFSEFFELSM